MDSVLPVHRLPDELLVHIWVLMELENFFERRLINVAPHPFILSWVCSRWRKTTLNTGLIWTSIIISAHNTSARFLSLQLERAKPYNLRVDISLNGNHHLEAQMNMICGVAGLWERLCVDYRGRFERQASVETQNATMVAACLRNVAVPQLRTLFVVGCPPETNLTLFQDGSAPMLSRVNLDGFDMWQNVGIFVRLTSLAIKNVTGLCSLTFARFRSVLSACPSLSQLAVHTQCIGYRIEHFRDKSLIDLPSLRMLELSFPYETSRELIQDLVYILMVPSLQTLRLFMMKNTTLRSTISAIKARQADYDNLELSKLCLGHSDCGRLGKEGLEFTEQDGFELFSCFPLMRELELAGLWWEPFFNALQADDPSHEQSNCLQCLVCPALLTLIFWAPGLSAGESVAVPRWIFRLQELVQTRKDAGLPLRELRLGGGAAESLPVSSQQWFSENMSEVNVNANPKASFASGLLVQDTFGR